MSETVSGEELEKINGYAREPLTEDKVFVFRVALCDNDIDRDGEKFSSGALEKLAELFKGRTGIFDHDPKSSKQTARIFDTWVETLPEKTTADGEVYRRLMAKAYMVRTASNGDLISEIQGGIKKEVSVSCTMGKKLCSVCGADMYKGGCDHEKGGEYGGKLCYHILDEPLDAYEWSFVAVPAQRAAGVVKKFSPRFEESEKKKEVKTVYDIVKKLADGEDSVTVAKEELNMLKTELKALFDRAECGDRYRAALCERIYKLSAVAQPEFKRGLTEAITKSLGIAELEEMAAALAKAAERKMPVMPQLAAEKTEDTNAADDGAFRI